MKSPLQLLRSRNIRFQLTSLMDLLLIIVFAQYLEFHRSSDAARVETQQEIATARQTLEEAYAEQSDELAELRRQLILDNQQLRERTEDAVVVAEEAQRRQAFTEELIKKLLQVDQEMVDPELSPPGSVETVRRAEATAEAIRDLDSTRLLRFLAGYDELLKRAEIWTIHVSDRGDTELDPGGDRSAAQSFRLEAATQAARKEEFVRQIRASYAQIAQPKGLVVILVSFSPRAVAGNYQPVLDAMPDVIEWLTKDSGGRTRFEYAVIGAITDPTRDLPVSEHSR